jgi:hypothetical protein
MKPWQMQMLCAHILPLDEAKWLGYDYFSSFIAHFANVRGTHAAIHCTAPAQGACSLLAPRVDSHSRRQHAADANDLASANRLFQLCFSLVLSAKSGFS